MSQLKFRSTAAATNAPAREAGFVLVFVALMLSMLLSALNQTILGTALPTIVGELNGASSMLWVITAFILASTITMPIYGKLGDLVGRKHLLISAILIFLAGSVVGALAPDMTWLIIARVIQGLGGGGLMILSQAIIADIVPARERGKYMGLMGGVFAFASVVGPLIGGWLTEGPGWRWVFWFNLPVGALALAGAVLFLRPKAVRVRPTLDIWGMVFIALATTGLVLVSSWGGSSYDWFSPVILGLIAATLISAVAFVLVERRTAEPIIPMALFRDRNFKLTTVAGLLTSVAMFGSIGYMPTYLQMATGASATEAGMLMIPMMGALLVSSIVSGQLVSRTGRYKWMPIAGSVIMVVALVLMGMLEPSSEVWHICLDLGILGLGLGLNMQILVLIVQNSFPNSQVGTATAANNFFRQIGATLGSAVVGSLFASRLTGFLDSRLPAEAAAATGGGESLTPALVQGLPGKLQDVIVTSYSEALIPLFLYMAPLAAIAAVLCLFVTEKPLATTLERDVVPESIGEGNGVPAPEKAPRPRSSALSGARSGRMAG
ncbi:MDR family MFS transporter [Arthrobacter sp. Br18]|uniref:MDR family MFS transporter n=1 Tax=Arthrobacter sp. Br18 TaxID=1312954 RepID=UPI0020A684C5|nr:MDR family MFS transporter [Arthrobacter sp. Br18]